MGWQKCSGIKRSYLVSLLVNYIDRWVCFETVI
ncbi:Uncharacterised protein [Shigella sonnei]|nr:Uncharacterised protein [Shigella sonnei]SJE29144.1 Uncharacterised protein [Shigella sonnei]SJF73814.1 Uncharacterised protein [Shigella sonnei]